MNEYMNKRAELEKCFNEKLMPSLKEDFNECIEAIKESYLKNNIDDDTVKHLSDSIWILCQSPEGEWTIDFGNGRKSNKNGIYCRR